MKQSPPPPGPVRNVSFPEVPLRELDNGLKVLVVENRRIPKIHVRLAVLAGKVDAPPESLALAPLSAELVEHGTETRSARALARLQDRWAIHYEGEGRLEYSLFEMDALKSASRPALDLLSDMLQHPAYRSEELERVRARLKNNLAVHLSRPGYLARERVYKTIFPGHPYANILMRPEHLEGISRNDLAEFHQSHFVPGRTLLAMAGDLDPDEGLGLAGEFFGQWRGEPADGPRYPELAHRRQPGVQLIHRPHSTQAHLRLAAPAFARNHPDARVFRVANQILGGGGSARLFLNLRERKGYTYGIYSSLSAFKKEGMLNISADVRSDAAADSIREVFRECRRLAEAPPGEDELRRSKAELEGRFIFRMESPSSVAMLELLRRIYDLPEDHYRRYIPDIEAVDGREVREAAAKYFDPGRFQVVVVADRQQVEDELKGLGLPVAVTDTDGNPI